jgi:hypothetical protein
MTETTKFTRRSLAKALAVSGVASALPRPLKGEPTGTPVSMHTASWLVVYPGVWRPTIGTPEA